MSCGVALAVSLLLSDPNVALAAALPPPVADAPVSLECRLADARQLTDCRGELAGAWLVVGEIVGVHIDRALLDGGLFATAEAGIVLRAGYAADYFEIRPEAAFSMRRPRD